MEVGTSFMSNVFNAIISQGSSNLLKNQLGGNEMKQVKGMNVAEVIAGAINNLNLGEEGEIKMETNTQTNTETVSPQAATVEEAQIMAEINEAVDQAAEETKIADVLSPSVRGMMLLNNDILSQPEIAITEQPLLNKVILAILARMKASYKMAGLLNEEKDEAIQGFFGAMERGETELSILPAGGIIFKIGDAEILKANCPKIVPITDNNTVFGLISSKGLKFNKDFKTIKAVLNAI
jgi:hypothetical protein